MPDLDGRSGFFDRFQKSLLLTTATPGVVLLYGLHAIMHLGPDDVIAMWDAGVNPLKAVHHQAGNFLLGADGGWRVLFVMA